MVHLDGHEPSALPVAGKACACGSGLSRANCCGLTLADVERLGEPRIDPALLDCLERAQAIDDVGAVGAAALAILEVAPAHRVALGALFNVVSGRGQKEAAAALAERAALLHRNDAVARLVAARFFIETADRPRAQIHARMLVRLAPEAAVSHYTMGTAFLLNNDGKAAEHHFRVALAFPVQRGPQVPVFEIEAGLALALRDQGLFEEARVIYARLLEADGARLAVLLSWAKLEEAAGNFAVAEGLLDRAAALAPHGALVAAARGALYRRMEQPERALAVLDTPRDPESGDEIGALLQKGQVLDSLGRYDEAFAAFEAGKRLLRDRSGQGYQRERAQALVASLRAFFTEGRGRLLPRAEHKLDSPQPIFIVGFPRSGTTLVEQTLSSHPQIAAGDELPIIHNVAERAARLLGSPLDYPQALSELWFGDRAGHVTVLRDLYLNEAARARAIDPAKRWFTDKMPLNETHLGLIHLLFPASPIIHLVRHPLDVVLSVFSNTLTHGFHCAYALESAAEHYALIAELIVQYRAALPLRYHEVRYERLVADQETVVRGMLDWIGEPFDARTLDFHTNRRPARTASYAQVTERLYSRSVHRYRPYLRHLAPVLPILQPAMARLGYTVDA